MRQNIAPIWRAGACSRGGVDAHRIAPWSGCANFSLPTYLAISIGPLDRQRTFHLRVDPGFIQLSSRDTMHAIQRQVLEGDLTCAQGTRAFRELHLRPNDFGLLWQMLAYGLSAAAAARFFSGGIREIMASAILGMMIGTLVVLLNMRRDRAAVTEFIAGILATMGAWMIAWIVPPIGTNIVVLASIVSLLPGYSLTTSLTEVATRNLASGGSRFVGAAMTLLALGFGVAIGDKIIEHLPAIQSVVSEPLLPWTILPAAFSIALAMLILLQAKFATVLLFCARCCWACTARGLARCWLVRNLACALARFL